MKFWQILLLFSVLFVIFLHFSQSLMLKTMNHVAQTEYFTDRNREKTKGIDRKKKPCDSYFVSVPQNLELAKECGVGRAKSAGCKLVSKGEFCEKLRKSGWDPAWTKRELAKKKNDKVILKTREKIKKNMGIVTEQQIKKCFPNYTN
jgi:hypothetical protein